LSKAQVQLLGRRLGWFAGIWTASVGALFIVAMLVRLVTGH
jgi:hypothetical protein